MQTIQMEAYELLDLFKQLLQKNEEKDQLAELCVEYVNSDGGTFFDYIALLGLSIRIEFL